MMESIVLLAQSWKSLLSVCPLQIYRIKCFVLKKHEIEHYNNERDGGLETINPYFSSEFNTTFS